MIKSVSKTMRDEATPEEDKAEEILGRFTEKEKKLLETYFTREMFMTSEGTVTRRRFSEWEDEKMKELVGNGKKVDWDYVAQFIPGRTGRQCKERWQNYLDPIINNAKWSEEEDKLLQEKYSEYGPKWVHISQFFNGRTDISIKNRWISLMRKDHIRGNERRSKSIRHARLVMKLDTNTSKKLNLST